MRFVQGIDYGPRKGTLGLSFHMSEGGDGLVGFLARHPGEDLWQWAHRVNGVSCNAALLSTGEVVQMLPWDHASGNLNPDDRVGEDGYYGHHHLVDVLGDHWPDPNTWTISMEIAGRRADGPTDAQVEAAIGWGLSMRAAFATIQGAVGHHDQAVKGCPGLTPNMKAIFAGVGGHGLFTEDPIMDSWEPNAAAVGQFTITVPDGHLIDAIDGHTQPVDVGYVRNVFSRVIWTSGHYAGQIGYLGSLGDRPVIAMAFLGSFVPAAVAVADCHVQDGRIRQAIIELGGTPP